MSRCCSSYCFVWILKFGIDCIFTFLIVCGLVLKCWLTHFHLYVSASFCIDCNFWILGGSPKVFLGQNLTEEAIHLWFQCRLLMLLVLCTWGMQCLWPLRLWSCFWILHNIFGFYQNTCHLICVHKNVDYAPILLTEICYSLLEQMLHFHVMHLSYILYNTWFMLVLPLSKIFLIVVYRYKVLVYFCQVLPSSAGLVVLFLYFSLQTHRYIYRRVFM